MGDNKIVLFTLAKNDVNFEMVTLQIYSLCKIRYVVLSVRYETADETV